MSDFEERVNKYTNEDAVRRLQWELENATRLATDVALKEAAALEKQRIENEFISRIRNSTAYKTASGEAHSSLLMEAFLYLHKVQKRTFRRKVEKRGWFFTSTEWVREEMPFDFSVNEIVDVKKGIVLVAGMDCSVEESAVHAKSGIMARHSTPFSFHFFVEKENLQLRRSCPGQKYSGRESAWEGAGPTASYTEIDLPFENLDEILEYMAKVVASEIRRNSRTT